MVGVADGRGVRLVVTLTVAFALVGAGRIPATQAQATPELQSIVGTWEGNLQTQVGPAYPMRLAIRDNGTWEMVPLDGDKVRTYAGTVRAVDGRLRFYTFVNGRTGTFSTSERNGQSLLQIQGDEQNFRAEMTRK